LAPVGGGNASFIDDFPMPLIKEWGDQVTNEIVRQLMKEGKFYSLEKPAELITIIKTQFLAAKVTPEGGRNDIPNRLNSYFAVFNFLMPHSASFEKIYATII
jgi:dynein heavy chain